MDTLQSDNNKNKKSIRGYISHDQETLIDGSLDPRH